MWTIVVSSIFLVMTTVDTALSDANGTSSLTLKPRISEFKKNVHHILEGARIRKKRQLEDSDPMEYKLKFDSANPEDLPYLSDYNLTFWLPVNMENKRKVLIGTTGGHIILFEMLDTGDKSAVSAAISEVEDIAIKARAFTHRNEDWFVVLHSSGHNYYLRMYQRIGRGLERRQKIDLTGFSDMELITVKGIHYLVAASHSTTAGQGFSYQATVTLYHWAQTQFDAIASRMTYGARSVVCWSLDGSLYIAIAQETNDEGNFKVGSPIFLYNSKGENRLVLWEMLATFGPSKVQHFYVAGNHYIVVIGKRDAVIYWWSNGQFLEWQSLLGTADASDVSAIALGDGEVAIVIALKEEAIFYTLDSSGYYIITLTMSFQGSSLRSLQFMFSGEAYYALALFTELQKHSVWKLTLASHYLPSVQSLDPLQQCLLDTQELLRERKMELEAIKKDLSRVWLKGSNQNITSKVVIKGNIVSNQQSTIKDVIIILEAKVPDYSMSLVIAALVKVSDSTEDVQEQLNGVVYKDTRQIIGGFKQFEEPVFIPSLTMETMNNVDVNDVSISRLQNYGLRRTGDQVFQKPTLVSNILTEKATVSSLNGVSLDDFLLLHGKQMVTGSLTFSNASMNSASVRTINSIPIEDIITTNTPQGIKSFKKLSVLTSDAIDVLGETNEVDLGSVSKKIATIDNYNEFMGHMTFLSPLAIEGSVFLTGKLNKMVDISELVHRSVNRDFQQDLTGRYIFKGKQTITGDLLVGGSINGVSLDNLLTLSSNQKIYADVSFSAPLTITRDLIVDTVNGVDLSEEVLQKLPPYQFISGRKIFTKDIVADFVDMTEYTTLDNVDPSFLVQDIVQHKQGVVNHNHTVFKDVNVLRNLTVLGDINGLNIWDALSSVWLKSVEQSIPSPVTANLLHLKNDLNVQSVNGLNLGEDVIRSYSDEIIEVSKTFEFKTASKSLNTGSGVINSMNLASLKTEMDNYQRGTIQGTKTLSALEIYGDLSVTNLNELEALDIMQPSAHQTVYGPVEFPAEITSVVGNVKSDSMSFTHFNGRDLQNYFKNAATLTSHSQPLKNKNFEHLKAVNLSVPSGSKISGVSLDEMKRRVVFLNVPQLITAPKSFAENLHFSKLINAATLNRLELSSFLNEIVLADEISKISNKQFLGTVRTTNAFVHGAINGIKIEDMAENVFYKSEDNVVQEHFVFEGDVDVEHLYSPVLDGVDWKDLIFLQDNEAIGTGWFLSNTHAERDVFVTGLVNGCDLSQISSSLYTNKTNQVIKKTVNVESVTVVGNLQVKNEINKIPVEALENLVTTSDDQVITSDAVVEANLIVDNLHMTDRANSDFAFVVKDAVRHSIPQEITGQKTFKESVTADVLTGGHVFASRVNGIDLEDLDSTVVWKNGHQEINGDKIFPSLVANVAIVHGFINGLKLPEDVVRTDTSEHITQPTYFMSDMYATTEVMVHGLIDGVNINQLIPNRVTLSGPQNVSAELAFYDDTVMYDQLIIDGTINEIVLDLVAKVKSVQPLQGYKVFIEFYVSGPVTASLVNGHDVAQLSSNILLYNKEDYANGIQVFEKPLRAENSLFAEWINDIPIRQLTEAFTSMMGNLKSVMGYLQDLTSSLQQKLIGQMSESEDKASKFAYFTLHQEIDIGPTSRILYGYNLDYPSSEFSHSLMMWTTEKHCVFMEKCCHLEFSYWLRVKKDGIVMADSAAESGRYYPIRNKSPIVGGEDFLIWTNVTDIQPKWCSNKQTRLVLASNNIDLTEIFIDMENPALLSDVKSFREGDLYAVAGFFLDPMKEEYGNTVVYAYDEKRHWTEWQILPSLGILSLDIISYTQGYRRDILLTLGTGMNTDPPSYSTVYKWNNNDRAFDFLQNIPSRYVTSTLWIQKGRDLLLSLAGVDYWTNKLVDCSELASGGQIDIYNYKSEQLVWIQSIPVSGIVSTVSFSLDGDTYLAAASSQEQGIYIFEWKGYAGFVKIQTISTEVRHIGIYSVQEDIYMTVASLTGPSKILKMARRGKQLETGKGFDLTLLEQDSVSKEQKVIKGC